MIDANSLVTLLGKTSNDPCVKSVLETMGYKQPVALSSYDEPTTYATLPKHGIEFIFEDEVKYKSLKYQEMGDGKLYLTDICLYLDNEDFEPYQDTLPFEISPNDTKSTNHENLGTPDRINPYFGHEEWEKDQCIVVVDYNSQDVISSVTIVAYTFEEAQEKGLYGFKD